MSGNRQEDSRTYKLGIGLKVLVIGLMLGAFAYLFFHFGKQTVQLEDANARINVMKNDSEKVFTITTETKEDQKALKDEIKNVNVVTDTGYITPEFMQLLREQKQRAERRGDKAVRVLGVTLPR